MLDIINRFDQALFNYINGLVRDDFIFNTLIVIYAEYFPFLFLLFFIFFLILKKITNEKVIYTLLKIFSSVLLAFLFKAIITIFFFRNRPFLVSDINLLLTPFPKSSAFPSGHTLTAFAIVTIIYFYNKKIGIVLSVLAFIGGLLRVFGGVHYPMDILGGIITGILAGVLVEKMYRKIRTIK